MFLTSLTPLKIIPQELQNEDEDMIHSSFLSIKKKKLKLMSKGLFRSCNYALARNSSKSRMVVYSEQTFKKKTCDPLQRNLSNFPKFLEYKQVSARIYNLVLNLGLIQLKIKMIACSPSTLTPKHWVGQSLHLGDANLEPSQTDGRSWSTMRLWALRWEGYEEPTFRNNCLPRCGGREWIINYEKCLLSTMAFACLGSFLKYWQ